MRETPAREKHIHEFFLLGVIGKGAISLVEIVLGVVVYFVPIASISGLVSTLGGSELSGNSGGALALFTRHFMESLVQISPVYMALYLLSRGLIKAALVVALLKDQLWAYPSSLLLLLFLIVYQLYQTWLTHSIPLVLLTLIDLIIMYFIWREYLIVKEHVSRAHT